MFAFNAKSFAIASLVFFSFFHSRHFSGQTAKSFLANVLRLVIKKPCDQDLTHSLDTPKNISVELVPEAFIRDVCRLRTVTSIHSIQKSTRNNDRNLERN